MKQIGGLYRRISVTHDSLAFWEWVDVQEPASRWNKSKDIHNISAKAEAARQARSVTTSCQSRPINA